MTDMGTITATIKVKGVWKARLKLYLLRRAIERLGQVKVSVEVE